ncbi:hypothetical protein L202_05521 [Cryptococcus amylolentus CBS 6039]|uniref:Uncharacterized protein n=1 Tax=Cryptococcus amylolentus CBS 6039 TaxID=1295533 RepID=A0A1E3HLE8_9TREE|nr:hypothetical protein L202_05521 [Cryptococcus amylolentus CBS 6039]ODN76955.1 hypothetical protein L202_05521 [Cryptococcus amylolentus CBS 6039]
MAPLRRQPACGDLHAGNRALPLPDTAHHGPRKRSSAAVLAERDDTKRLKETKQPLTKRSEPLLRPSRPAASPLSPETPTIVLGSRTRSMDFEMSTVPLLNHPKPPRRFLQSEYPSSAGPSDLQPSHPMVREYTSMGWSAHPSSPPSPVESPKRPDGLPLGESGLERTKNGNSKSPWHMMVQSPHRASPAPSSIRDPGPAPQASLPGPAPRAINLGHTAWPSISSDGVYSPVCGTPSHSDRSSLSAPGSMSDHGDIQIMRATSAQMQVRPPMTFLANASDVSILAPSSLGIGYASSIEDSPGSLLESLEAECVDLTESGLRVSQASNKTDKRSSGQSRTPSPDAVEALTAVAGQPAKASQADAISRNAYFIPPAHHQGALQMNTVPRLKRAHTYDNLKTVYALASFPGGPIEVQPEQEPPAETPPRLGTPIDLAPRSASSSRTSAEPSMFPSAPRRSHAPSFRPVSLCSPSDAIEELLPVSPFQSPETSNRSKGKRSPFQQTRESLKGILLPVKGRSLIQTFDRAEHAQIDKSRQSALKSKISGPLEVYGIKTDVRERKKSEREWREEVLRDVVGRSLSSQFRLVEGTKRQIGGSEGVPRISSGSSKSRLPIPGALLAGVTPNPSVTGEKMDSSRNLQAVMGESPVPKKAVDFRAQRLPGKGRPTSAPLLAPWSPARRSKSGRTLSELINPSIVINQPSPKRQLASVPDPRPASPSPAPRLERSKSGRISRRASILNFFKKDKAKERDVHQVSPKAKKMPSTTFTITASIRSSFLALTKHHVGDPAQPQPEGRKSPRSSSATPPSTIPLRTPIHTNPDSVFRRPPSKAESSFEMTYHLPEVEGGRPLLEELMARDEALGALEGRRKSRGETYGMPGMNKVLEWRKDLEEGS